jgi:glutamine cyclotransferase
MAGGGAGVTGTITVRFAFPPPPIPDGVRIERAEIVNAFPHDPAAFTQGLLWTGGRLFESTGEIGRSELREIRLGDGAVLRRVPFPAGAWGEGIADWDDEILGLTLDSGMALRWRLDDFAPVGQLACPAPAWGLARIGDALAISDGTALLRFVDPASFAVRRTLEVREAGQPLGRLNALARVDGALLANVFMTDTIARIDPATGEVTARIDCSPVVAASGRRDFTGLLNGIAWDEGAGRVFVTGKNWPRLFEIRLG